MEEKQAELENPVESWNLSVKDVRKILSGKHRPSRRSASKDDIIQEGDYPDDDEEEEEDKEEVGVAKEAITMVTGEVHESGHQQEFIAEFPPRHEPSPPRRQTRSSTAKKLHAERSSASPVSGSVPIAAAKQKSEQPTGSQRRVSASAGEVQRKQPSPGAPVPQIPQPTALPPAHLKTPVTMVISRDPRVAKRQQQLLEKTQGSPQPQQPQQTGQTGQTGNSGEDNGAGSSKSSVDGRSLPSSSQVAEATQQQQQKALEVDEARMRERLLLRQKYRIRKASDRRDSREDSSEERQMSPTCTSTLPTPPPPPPSQPVKSCLVRSPTTSVPAAQSPTTAAEVRPEQGGHHHPQGPLAPTEARPDHQPSVASRDTNLSEQGDGGYAYPPQRQTGFVGAPPQTTEEAVEQSTGELELSPHKKAVFMLDSKAAPVDVTSLPPVVQQPASRTGPMHEVLPDSRVEPETGEVESTNIAQTPGTGSSGTQVGANMEPTPTTEEMDRVEDKEKSDGEDRGEKEVGSSSESSEEEGEIEDVGGIKTREGVAIGQCYMDQEEEGGVASDRGRKEEER